MQVVMATGMAEDGEAAVTMFTLAIGALGSDSARATEMILTVGAGPPLGMFGFAATRITDHFSCAIAENIPAIAASIGMQDGAAVRE